jgi:zinc/manganese transport system substrate-binding protein
MSLLDRSLTRRRAVTGVAALAAAFAVHGVADRARAQASAVPPFEALPALPDAPEREGGALRVAATTTIVADLVRQIGGARVDVATIMPPNADPHDFEPAPKDIAAVEDVALVFAIGLELDVATTDLIMGAARNAELVTVTDGIETLELGEDAHADEDEDAHDDHDGDPHVWFDPTRTMVMADRIASALTAIDPDGADDYATRLAAYRANLDALDVAIAERVALVPEDRRKLITNHDAIGYYAARYGLEIVGTVIPGLDTRSEPSAKEIAALIDLIEAEGVRVIFAENTVSAGLAEELAAQAGITVVDTLYTDSLGAEGSGVETYIAMMEWNTIAIVDALLAAG